MSIKKVVNELLERGWDFEISENVLYMVLGNETYAIPVNDKEALKELYNDIIAW